ncbi:MAG TPA: DUF2127 domain-containing protein, partial [Pyrinomonadaceae bacterium]|nr:DUF2127 domain-containing protein [Pyrinomonadaceae bacterium]
KIIKGIILIIVGVKLLTLLNKDVAEWFADFVARHNIDAENKYIHSLMEKLSGINNNQIMLFSVGSFLYAGLDFTEGIGLWFEQRWAEILTSVATALFVPLEIYEIYERFTLVRVLILIVNLFVIWYLATRVKDEVVEEIKAHESEIGKENL